MKQRNQVNAPNYHQELYRHNFDYKSPKENPKSKNLFLDEIKPLLYLLEAFGRFPCTFDGSQITFKLLSWPVVYSLLAFSIQLYGTVYTLTTLISVKLANATSFDETIYGITLGMSLLQNLTLPLAWWEIPKVIAYVRDWHHFQEEFGSEEFGLRLKKPVKIVAIAHIPGYLVILLIKVYLVGEAQLVVCLPYVSALGSMTTCLMIWCTTLYELECASEKLLARIVESGCRNISSHRILWLKLSSLVFDSGECIGRTGIAMSSLVFTIFIFTSYGILALLMELSITKSFMGLLMTSCICMAGYFLPCNCAHNTVHALHLFLQTMAINKPRVHLLGFLKINRHLLVTFISNTVTYMVVLLQFKASSLTSSLANGSRVKNQ